MEAKIDQLLVPALLKYGVDYHCRRGIRYGCVCNYCMHKRGVGSRFQFRNLVHEVHARTRELAKSYAYYSESYLSDYYHYALRDLRKEKRVGIRHELFHIKQDELF